HVTGVQTCALPISGREALSRGQTKLAAMAMLLAQARDFARRRGHWPVMALDDLPSELDRGHQQRVLAFLAGQPGVQILVTATETPPAVESMQGLAMSVFHVEQGSIARLDGVPGPGGGA